MTKKYIIVVFGPNKSRLGYWRRLSDGEIATFDSESEARQVMACWGIDGEIVTQ